MKVLCGLILLFSLNLVLLNAANCPGAPSQCTCTAKIKKVSCTQAYTITKIPSWIPSDAQLLDLIECNIRNITKDSFKNLRSLVRIDLTNQAGSRLNIADNAVFQGLENLTTVRLGHNAIASIPAGLFANLSKLNVVSFGYSQLQTLPDDLFQNSPNVEYLNIPYTHLVKEVLAKIGQGMFAKNIISLVISGTPISDLKAGFFTGLQQLKSLGIANCDISYIRADVLNGTKVTTVNFEENPIELIDPNAFRGVALTTFECSKCKLTSEVVYGFIKDIKSLRRLRLQHNQITNIPKNVFSGLVDLDEINLSNNTIETIEKNAFADLPKCNNEQTECIQLQQNPLKCDCNLAWFHDWTKKWQYREQLKCKTPDSVSGKKFTALDVSQFCCSLNGTKCGNPMPTGTTPNLTGTTPNTTGTTPNTTGTTPNPNHASTLFSSFTKIATEMAIFGLITWLIF